MKQKRRAPTIAEAREWLSYCPETGQIRRRVDDRIVGHGDGKGYVRIECHGTRAYAHRLAWMLTYGVEPPEFVDHINGDASDNRLCNLRLATRSQNACNSRLRSDNTSGMRNVSPKNGGRKWQARVIGEGKRIHVGTFSTAEEASRAAMEARATAQGAFARDIGGARG